MKKLKRGAVIMDRLSVLPGSLLLEILSLLDMKDVVKTTLLSKRWKDFWVTIPCLKFTGNVHELVKIYNFVCCSLLVWRGTHLREFSISFFGDSLMSEESFETLSLAMTLWVQFVMGKNVQDLFIKYKCRGSFLRLPQCLYECSSIRNLSLYGCNLQIHGNVKWDHLNTLMLDDCVLSEDVINQVLSSSPQLEDFRVRCTHYKIQGLSIRSSSLKKLFICYYDCNPSVLTIWAPNLQVLTYSGKPHAKCLLTDISSLNEVHLDFPVHTSRAEVKEALRQILPAIQHVVTVQLSVVIFQGGLRFIKGEKFSPLLNVKLLKIDSLFIGLPDIVGLLECFPKLEKLIICGKSVSERLKFNTESEANILKSNLLQLRTVVISWHPSSYNAFFQFIEFLLKHATMIEKMVIRLRRGVDNLEDMFEAAKKLINLQRSFPCIELILC